MLDQTLGGLPIAVVDFEATGIDNLLDWPVQVAVVTCDLGETEPVLAYESLICPPIPIPEASSEIHGIVDADVAQAPLPSVAVKQAAAKVFGRVFVAYNAVYDGQFMARFVPMEPVFIDPFVLVRQLDKFKKGKKLVQACERRGISLEGAHDAGADAMATAKLLPVLLDEICAGGGKPWREWTLRQLWQRQCLRAVEQEEDLAEYFRSKNKPFSPNWAPLLARLLQRSAA